MSAYRTGGWACPRCASSALREFHERLVCDECAGMLITAADLAASIEELDGSTDAVGFVGAEPTTRACPRCTRPMTTSAIRIGTLEAGRLDHCAADGIWFPRDAMTSVFARVSRRGGFRGLGAAGGGGLAVGVRGTASAGVGDMPSGHGGMSGAMASIQGAFGGGAPASGGLAISRWHDHRPRVHTLFVSAHKDRRLGCPVCPDTALDYRGDRWACATCAGAFVETVALAAMVEDMAQQPWEAPAVSGAPGERACPLCEVAMTVDVLEAVTVDRCASHGVWFDDTELQAALHHASVPPSGLGGWLKRLFHRHGERERSKPPDRPAVK